MSAAGRRVGRGRPRHPGPLGGQAPPFPLGWPSSLRGAPWPWLPGRQEEGEDKGGAIYRADAAGRAACGSGLVSMLLFPQDPAQGPWRAPCPLRP